MYCSPFADIIWFVLHLGPSPNTKADQCTQWGGWMVNNAKTHQAAHAGRVGGPGHPPHNGEGGSASQGDHTLHLWILQKCTFSFAGTSATLYLPSQKRFIPEEASPLSSHSLWRLWSCLCCCETRTSRNAGTLQEVDLRYVMLSFVSCFELNCVDSLVFSFASCFYF